MTTPAPTIVKTITEAEIRDMTHDCHFLGLAPRDVVTVSTPFGSSLQKIASGFEF